MRSLLLATSVVGLMVFSNPIHAQDLESRLQTAVDAQQWVEAIQIIDQMLIEQPVHRDYLLEYREQLAELGGSDLDIPPPPTPTPSPSQPDPTPSPGPITFHNDEGTIEATIDFYNGTFIEGTVTNKGDDPLYNVHAVYEILDPDGNIVATESVLTIQRSANPGETINYQATTPAEGTGFWVRIKEVEWQD